MTGLLKLNGIVRYRLYPLTRQSHLITILKKKKPFENIVENVAGYCEVQA